jgi:diguanylate cyclase (GGDEF)-like protein
MEVRADDSRHSPMPEDLRILFVDDSRADIELERYQLVRDGLVFEWRAASDEASLKLQLEGFKPHLVLCDYTIPGFSGRAALQIVLAQSPATPFIFVSGTIGEERAIECLREGAVDYVLKDNARRLGTAVRRAIAEAEERKRYEARIRYLANFDALTDLPNRVLLRDRLEQAIVHASRTGRAVAVVVLDLDGFHHLNGAFGSRSGDDMLCHVAARLSAVTRAGDTVARAGGNEFIALISDLRELGDATSLVYQLIEGVKEPLTIGDRTVSMTASAGVAFFPNDGRSPESLLQAASSAMHRAKKEERGAFLFAGSPEATRQSLNRVMIESGLRQALKRKEIALAYQLQYNLATGRACGVEALMRWRPAELDYPPSEFIPVAEETGLIRELGHWAMREACRQALPWMSSGDSDFALGVNISAVQLDEKTFIPNLRSILQSRGFPPHRLEVEITETALMKTSDGVLAVMEALRELGVRIAIDDFGTGYSSLAYLSRLPIGRLKIDAGFVHRMAKDPRDLKIAQSIVSLGHGLGIKVIAEGVETEEQLDMLRRMECDQVQGYLMGRPDAAERIAERLER